jgi:type VI secretion system protein ImpL
MALSDFLFSFSFLGLFSPLVVAFLLALVLAIVVRKFFFSGAGSSPKKTARGKSLWGVLLRLSLPLFREDSSSLGKAFQEAMRTLKSYTGGTNFPYQLPFYLMVGPESSGKNTLLNKLDIPLPATHPHGSGEQISPCDFWFFDLAVIMNLRGDLFIEHEKATSHTQEWGAFLRLLRNVRPNQPLNGVVLCVSAEELLTLDPQILATRASYIHEKFREARETLGVKLPIFVVITKTDVVAGFSSFCHEIPSENKGDIFGWSTPYALDLPYHENWIDEIFDTISSQIMRLQQEIFVEGNVLSEKDGLCLFPYEFQKLKIPLDTYLRSIFAKAKLSEGFLLRGLFFVGDGEIDLHSMPVILQQKMRDALVEGNPFQKEGPKPLSIVHKRSVKEIYFSKNLFQEKIFAEQGLATPLSSNLLSRNHSLRVLQTFAAALALVSGVALFHAHSQLDRTRRMLMPYIDEIGGVIQRALAKGQQKESEHTFFQKQAQSLLPAVINVYTHKLSSWFIPFSWLSPLELKVQRVVELAYYQVIFKAITQKLTENLNALVQGNVASLPLERQAKKPTPLSTTFFRELDRYVKELGLYQSMAERYNNLRHSRQLSDFGFLVKNLFGFEVPDSFINASGSLYTGFFSSTKESEQVRLFLYEKPAIHRFDHYKHRFVDNGFRVKLLFPSLSDLMRNLHLFWQAKPNYSLKDLRALAKALAESVNAFASPDAAWVSRGLFDPGPPFDRLCKNIAQLSLLPANATDKFKESSQAAFEQLKGTLAAYGSPVVGKVFTVEDSTFRVSTALLNFQGLLNLILSQPFMYPPHAPQDLRSESFDKTLSWRIESLRDAIELIKKFDAFFKDRLLSLPEKTRSVLRSVCFHTLSQTLQGTLYDAQEFMPIDQHVSSLAPEETYLTEIRNLKALIPVLGPLLSSLKKAGLTKLYNDLKTIVHDQALRMLERVNAIYESEAPYEARYDVVSQWSGDPRHVFAAFGASSQQDLKNYLTTQRERLRYLAKDFSEPPLEILKIIYASDASSLPNLMIKWSDILTQLQFYERNAPNTLQMLENFISTTLPSLTLEGCPIVLHLAKNPSGIDYFLDRINSIRTTFAKQCATANREASLASYRKITNFFNTHLAGRYPFVPKNFETEDDASLEKLKVFFALFDKEGPYVKELLTRESQQKPHYLKALMFIKQIEQTRAFFRMCIDSASADKPASLPLDITFRANRENEKQASQLISWSLSSGDNTFFAKNKTAKLWWEQGSDMKVNFRWALGSMRRPVPSSLQPNMKVEGPTATLSYGGNWSLLKLLQSQSAQKEDGPDGGQGFMLKFQIPTAPKDQTYPKQCDEDRIPPPEASELVVFIKMIVGGDELSKVVSIPSVFPFIAPTLSQLEGMAKQEGVRARQNKACRIPDDPKEDEDA